MSQSIVSWEVPCLVSLLLISQSSMECQGKEGFPSVFSGFFLSLDLRLGLLSNKFKFEDLLYF